MMLATPRRWPSLNSLAGQADLRCRWPERCCETTGRRREGAWLGSAAFIALLVYRPAEFPGSTYLAFYALVSVVVGSNVLLHWRVRSPRPMGSF